MTSKTLKNQKPAARPFTEHRVPKHKARPPIRPELATLAVLHLGDAFAELEPRGSDRLDFHEASVAGVRDLVEAAFEHGRASVRLERSTALDDLLALIEEGVTVDGVLTIAPAREALKLVKAVRS